MAIEKAAAVTEAQVAATAAVMAGQKDHVVGPFLLARRGRRAGKLTSDGFLAARAPANSNLHNHEPMRGTKPFGPYLLFKMDGPQ